MSEQLLFNLVFLSQIVLISYYFPKKILARINYVLTHFPQENYPKFYSYSTEKIHVSKTIFKLANYFMFFVGLFILYLYLSSNDKSVFADAYEVLPLMFGMAQFVPYLLLELFGFKQLKLMRQANIEGKRSADLTPRRLFDFVSPALVISAAVLYIGAIVFDLYLTNFVITEDVLIKALSLTLCNSLFIALGYWHLKGKKQDPYQANNDRLKLIKFSLRAMVLVSILVSLFITAQTLVNTYQLGLIEMMLNSLYWQLIALLGVGTLLSSIKVEDIDFTVYKKSN